MEGTWTEIKEKLTEKKKIEGKWKEMKGKWMDNQVENIGKKANERKIKEKSKENRRKIEDISKEMKGN